MLDPKKHWKPGSLFLLLFIFIVCTLYLRWGLCRGKRPCFGIHCEQPSAETPQKHCKNLETITLYLPQVHYCNCALRVRAEHGGAGTEWSQGKTPWKQGHRHEVSARSIVQRAEVLQVSKHECKEAGPWIEKGKLLNEGSLEEDATNNFNWVLTGKLVIQFYIAVPYISYRWCLYSECKLSVRTSHKKAWDFCLIIDNFYCVIGKCKYDITFYFIELQCNYPW